VPLLATAKVVGSYVHRKLLGLPPWPLEAVESADEDLPEIESPPAPEKERAYQA